MTSEELQNIIKSELDAEKDFFNPHDVDLKSCLIKPIKQIYLDPLDHKKKYELWTVFEESPDLNGYKIFYNEEENSFGLGVKSGKDDLICIGKCGSFINTLSSM